MIKTNRKTDLLTWEKKQWLEIVFLEQEKNEDIADDNMLIKPTFLGCFFGKMRLYFVSEDT